MKTLKNLLSLAIFGLTASTAFADYRIINQTSNDITVLSASVSSLTVKDLLSPEDALLYCDHKGTGRYGAVDLDCRNELARRLNYPLLATRLSTKVYKDHTGTLIYGDGAGEIPIVFIDTVSREAALAEAGAFGMYIDQSGYSIVNPSQLEEVGEVTLRDGSKGLVHKFASLFFSSGHSGSGIIRSLGFKPFLDFHVPSEGVLYRNWDSGTSTYMGANWSLIVNYEPYRRDLLSFDRRSELLQ